jgi:hypothetical protein
MMRASLVVLCLLVSVVTASADCAWVLWNRETWTNCAEDVRIAEFVDREDAFETKAECMKEWQTVYRATGSGKPHVVKRTVDGTYRDIVVVNRANCWPAVVDIREVGR